MPIHMGIICEKCHKVHFIGTSSGIKPLPTRGMYALSCRFCSERREFRKETMHPYRVSDAVFRTGHANEGETGPIPVLTKKPSGPCHRTISATPQSVNRRNLADNTHHSDEIFIIRSSVLCGRQHAAVRLWLLNKLLETHRET